MKSAAVRYLREVNKQIICPNSIKKDFLCQLENETLLFCAAHTDADILTLSNQFGSPEEVAEEFLSELGEQAVRRYKQTCKKLLLLTFGVILSAVIFTAIISVQTTSLQQQLPDGEFVASIIYEAEPDSDVSCFPSRDTIFDSN